MLALDLFCGAGGAGEGLKNAGFDVIGIEIDPSKARRNIHKVIVADAYAPPVLLNDFDFIWASPPCQAYSKASYAAGTKELHDYYAVQKTRDLLHGCTVPWVIENVTTAPIRHDIILQGADVGLKILRRRAFECGNWTPPFRLEKQWYLKSVKNGDLATVAGHGGGASKKSRVDKRYAHKIKKINSMKSWREVMEIDWMTRDDLSQAVPPRYSECIAKQMLGIDCAW